LYKTLIMVKNYFNSYSRRSYSQFGEDVVLLNFIDTSKFNSGLYVDIGSYHPCKFSNTYLFYKKGWHGINIDARPGSMNAFVKKRKRDINLEIGISEAEKDLDFYVFDDSYAACNTFSKQIADNHICNHMPIKTVVKVKTMRLENILDKYLMENKKIIFMSIDVEGLDFEVL
jgi:hypothetical protein